LERLIQNAADLRRRQRLATEADRADAPYHVAVAEHLVTADLIQTAPQPLRQRRLVSVDLLQSLFHDVLPSRGQPGDPAHVARAAFEEVGELARLRLAGRVAARAALAPRPHPG